MRVSDVEVQSIEATQAIQVLVEPFDRFVDFLTMNGGFPMPLIGEKPAIFRVYPGQVAKPQKVKVEVCAFDSDELELVSLPPVERDPVPVSPECTAADRRTQRERSGLACGSIDFEVEKPSETDSDAQILVTDEHGNLLHSVQFPLLGEPPVGGCLEADLDGYRIVGASDFFGFLRPARA